MIPLRTPRPKALWAQIRDAKQPPQRKLRKPIQRRPIRRKPPSQERKLDAIEAAAWIKEKQALGVCCPIMFALHKKRVEVTDRHHIRGRHGVLLRDKRFWWPVSREGHV